MSAIFPVQCPFSKGEIAACGGATHCVKSDDKLLGTEAPRVETFRSLQTLTGFLDLSLGLRR